MGALQVWQSLSEAQGRGHGDREVAIVFTDLVGFSDWVLEAGDERAVELVRAVGEAVEGVVRARGGRVVKRLGDGLMAVFDDPAAAVRAACEATAAAGELHAPGLRAGVHLGRPRRLGGDYFGVDVNVAARVAARRRRAARCSSPTPSATASTPSRSPPGGAGASSPRAPRRGCRHTSPSMPADGAANVRSVRGQNSTRAGIGRGSEGYLYLRCVTSPPGPSPSS